MSLLARLEVDQCMLDKPQSFKHTTVIWHCMMQWVPH